MSKHQACACLLLLMDARLRRSGALKRTWKLIAGCRANAAGAFVDQATRQSKGCCKVAEHSSMDKCIQASSEL